MKSNWNVKLYGQGLSANEIITQILENRCIPKDAQQEFNRPAADFIFPSKCFKNIENAAEVFMDYCHSCLIYADTDTDGCTSAAIMWRYISNYSGIQPKLYINNGKDHGIQDYFDFNSLADIDLVIIVDSINDKPDMYQRILDMGKHIIVLDHHIPSSEILNIQDKINLVSSANGYPNSHLSGAGVCWKFCNYIDYVTGNTYADELTCLAAVGIIADVCSVGVVSMENRAICNQGFNLDTNSAILKLCGGESFNATTVSFNIAPLINAANRMNKNELALELFITDDRARLVEIIKDLENVRKQQKDIVNKLFPQLLEEGELQKDKKCSIFIVKDIDNLGGLLATKLTAYYHKPCLVLHDTGDNYEGSMRAEGVENFAKLVNDSGLGECAGHENSAGICIPKSNFSIFINYIEDALQDTSFVETLDVDVCLDRVQITPFLIQKLEEVSRISGKDFESIKVLIKDVKNYEIKKLSQGKHLSVGVPDMKFLCWNFSDWDLICENGTFSAVGTLSVNKFMGKTTNQMMIEDFEFIPNSTKFDLW